MTAWVMLLGLTASAAAAPVAEHELPAPGTYFWLDHHRLHLNCAGSGGPTVVLDAGLGGTSLEWALVQPEIAQITRVCSYDRAGYGWSDFNPVPRTSDTIVSELYQLLGAASVAAPYVLVGHSFGGLSMRLFAARFPAMTAGLVLLDATHETQFKGAPGSKPNKMLVPRRNRSFVIGNHWQIPAGMPDELRTTAQRLALAPDSARALYSELRHIRMSAAQVGAAAKMPEVPLIVIAHDSRARAKTSSARVFADQWMALQRELAARSPGGRLILAGESGHHIHLEQPELVIGAIRQLVLDLRARSASRASTLAAVR